LRPEIRAVIPESGGDVAFDPQRTVAIRNDGCWYRPRLRRSKVVLARKLAVIALRVLKDNAKNLYGAKYGLLRHMGGQTDPGAAASSSSQANIKLRSSIIKR